MSYLGDVLKLPLHSYAVKVFSSPWCMWVHHSDCMEYTQLGSEWTTMKQIGKSLKSGGVAMHLLLLLFKNVTKPQNSL